MDGTGTHVLRVCERRRDIIIILVYSSSAAGNKNDLLGSSSSSRRGLQHHFKAYGKQELGGAAEVSERTKGRGGIFASSLPPSPQASPQAKAWHPLHREGAEESNHIRTVDAYESGKYSTHAPTTFQLIGAGYISDTAV
jgi:hypothetical protein